MSRVGGGGYAESRGGGVGDGTGGGMSANGRDGLGGSGKGDDSALASERQRLRSLGATTITPKYGWEDARFSDFGISGGLMNAVKGLIAGNTYVGRMPQGLRGGFAPDSNKQLMSLMNPGMVKGPQLIPQSGYGAKPSPQPTMQQVLAQYFGINTPGLDEYGVWSPTHSFPA